MTSFSTPAAVLAGMTLFLSACTDPASLGQSSGHVNRNVGAGIGGLLGAAAGSAIAGSGGNQTTSAVLGGIAGAAAGGIIGNRLDQQAAELNASLTDEIDVRNEGDRLIVTLPEDVTFDTASDFVRPDLQAELTKVAASLQKYPETSVQVIGHTDSEGDASYNQSLSERRANAVSSVLQSGGVSSGRIATTGRGEDEPAASNLTPEGRAQNRRVEIVVIPEAV